MRRTLKICVLLFLTCTPGLVSISFAATAHCDFNNDGYDDLAIGVPRETYTVVAGGDVRLGRVHVIYGTNTGLNAAGNQLWSRDSAGILGEGSDIDFGFSLTCGDFDGNGFSDLAISSRDQSVNVLYGSSTGLTASGNQLWNQDSPGLLDTREDFDAFGTALAAGDFNGDGYSDLAIGVPGETFVSERRDAGAVHIIYGSSIGLTSANNQLWTQNSSGITDFMEINDQFGTALAAGNFGKDSATGCYDDLAIGVLESSGLVNEEEQLYTLPGYGAVHVLYGTNAGLSSAGSQFYHQDSPGIPGTNQPREEFGSVLGAGIFGGVTTACGALSDLVIGIPRAKLSDAYSNSGAVLVLYATTNGLTTTGNQLIHQDTAGVPDTTEGEDFYGQALATGRTTSGRHYLAIAAPEEGLSVPDTGIVDVFYADPSTGKLTTAGMKHYSQNSAGVPDSNEPYERWGTALTAGNYNGFGDDDLAVGSPFETFNDLQFAGAVHILYGASTNTTQEWTQNSPGILDFMENLNYFGSVFP